MGVRFEKSAQISLKQGLLRKMYLHVLLTRLVDESAWQAYQQGLVGFVASCRGHEAVQVSSALCIQIGQDFTLPYYRDLGVVLTIGMTPYEVFRTYAQTRQEQLAQPGSAPHTPRPVSHWGYHKHNLVTGPAPVATQIMHAAGIAFACKLRKSSAVTLAYCGDGASAEPDFLEGLTFAAQHQLPALFICEQDAPDFQTTTLSQLSLPTGLTHQRIDGSDVGAVYEAVQAAIQRARAGDGPSLLEMCVVRANPGTPLARDPLQVCVHLLQEHGAWDETWASELETRMRREVTQALEEALRDEPEKA